MIDQWMCLREINLSRDLYQIQNNYLIDKNQTSRDASMARE